MNYDLDILNNYNCLIGCDEVGRGPIAGPVNACAVRFSSPSILEKLRELNVTDSKKISDIKRKKILEKLEIDALNIEVDRLYDCCFQGETFSFCISENDHKVIDKINILQASLLAMKTASDKLILPNSKVLVDGNKTFESVAVIESIIKGDSKVIAIGLASIIAKVFRDEKMGKLDLVYPGYNLGKHAGYPTKEHKLAVQRLGPSPIHRRSFKGVKEYC